MKCCHVEVYLAGTKDGVRAGMALDLALEARELQKKGYVWIWPLTVKMGLSRAFRLVQELQSWPWQEWLPENRFVCELKNKPTGGWQRAVLGDAEENVTVIGTARKKKRWFPGKELDEYWQDRRWQKRVVRGLQWFARYVGWEKMVVPLTHPRALTELIGEECEEFSLQTRQVGAMLRGRNLFLDEIVRGMREMGVMAPDEVYTLLIPLLVTGQVEMLPAVSTMEEVCERCGHTGVVQGQCGICGDLFWYCPDCREMGESTSCRPLFRRADRGVPRISESSVQPQYAFPLSKYQEELSCRLVQALEGKQKKEWLLWAVCGAGKTETTFGMMGEVLGRGGRVLFTSPRREVVRQMVERLGQAFPLVSRVGLYGGSEEKLAQAQLTVATVHQLLRFYRAFDLVIFDEVDAFPYKGDLRLQRLLRRSLKENGRLIYLSATPDTSLLKKAEQGELEVLTLPARFHRKGVPVPELRVSSLPKDPVVDTMPQEVLQWIREAVLKDLAQLYIFLPGRKMVERFGESLRELYGKEDLADWVEYTHSQDEERSAKVERFLRGDYPILVTTTIMERGVTVPKGNVLVLYADSGGIFDSQSLVQMAGRAGRSLEAPHANVLFVGKKITGAMREAREWILRMNADARERGLLDAEVDDKDS